MQGKKEKKNWKEITFCLWLSKELFFLSQGIQNCIDSIFPMMAITNSDFPSESNGEGGYSSCIRCGSEDFCFQTLYWNLRNRAVLSLIYVFYYAYIHGLVIKCSCQEASCIWKMLWLFYLNSRVCVGFQNLVGCLGVFKEVWSVANALGSCTAGWAVGSWSSGKALRCKPQPITWDIRSGLE